MDMPDWNEVGTALGALAVVVLPLLLARWLILRHKDEPGGPGAEAPTRRPP